jgi:very-short-patch-repair endonuclease
MVKPPLRYSPYCPPPLAGGGAGEGDATMSIRHPLISSARKLRNNSTDIERLLWRYLRNSQFEGIKFRRQQPVEDYIVDFVSFSPKLVIEVDGGQHMDNQAYDERRDECLRKNGFAVLRFWNIEVVKNLENVLEEIRQCCMELGSPTPQPPPAKGGGI